MILIENLVIIQMSIRRWAKLWNIQIMENYTAVQKKNNLDILL